MVQISEKFRRLHISIDARLQPQAHERRQLEQLWQSGRLHRHLDALERFYSEKRSEFIELLEDPTDNENLVAIAKLLVVQNGIVDRIAETLDQIQEIESEIWIQGELGNHDRNQIAADWTRRYARSWREWRIKEYLFAVEQMQHRLPQCLQLAS
ncbi:hypothetical protein [Pelagicoccus sp. SDUM812002]|uniref:hypothetical protein n=1 Tax=Pelagicoccus sp. SDUM812002 TaxID=3041266 RepID=UPI00280D823D|nr:hypothetical protein [Pelagicoccus sp. SDUM812002]MDQ8184996.1 hypothetical protein [Pelagicoccus sp. SDUM812002]